MIATDEKIIELLNRGEFMGFGYSGGDGIFGGGSNWIIWLILLLCLFGTGRRGGCGC